MSPDGRPAGAARRGFLSMASAMVWSVGVLLVATPSTPAGSTAPTIEPVSAFGAAPALGAPDPGQLNDPLTGLAATPDGKGYWLVAADGGVFAYGDAGFYGSSAGSPLVVPWVGIAPTPDGRGYWTTNSFGATSNFGDAPNEGTIPVTPVAPVVGIAATPGSGYWLAAADGGVFAVGDAAYLGSMGGIRLNAAIVGMASTPDGKGYWLVAADGGVFAFGDAAYLGSMGGHTLNAPVVGMAATPDGKGYWLVAADGGVFSFGDATFRGSTGDTPPALTTPVVGMAATTDGDGYWLATTDKPVPAQGPVPTVTAACNDPSIPPAVEPATIVLACADANDRLIDLAWTSWSATSAAASGGYTHNVCVPTCAAGTFVTYPASVRLAYPIQSGTGLRFASLTYVYADPAAPGGSVGVTTVIPTGAF